MKINKLFFILIFLIGSLFAQDSSQTFLSLRNTHVEDFQKAHPDYDGRGTIVIVLDTGVDMGVDGLTKTTIGDVKVIDVQDFTGQGDTPFFEAEIEELNDTLFFINEDKNYKVAGVNSLTLKTTDDNYFIGNLNETLWKNSGSHAGDVNGNGKTNDNFYFITFRTTANGENFWVVYLDCDADGDLADEKPIRNYKENFDSFVLPNSKGLPKFSIGLNIFPEKKIVSFYFDDGSHGTHCAGISTGNRIGDTELYGVAPGAKVIGLKLGNNNFAGGATVSESMKKAYLYADKVSKERKEPCIINMSFGIGSEIEGHADIELFLNDLVKDNPYLYIATSNGNEGPGLSTTGMPAASESIFSTGALLAEEVGNDLYGTTLNKDIILHFSSRGGEVSKPDVVAPGACVSTVPNFSRGDRFWGTSMASPYSAGVMAVLLGAMKVEYPDVKIPSRLLYKVLRESAQPMEGYTYLDQGAGLINLGGAYELLKKYIEKGEIKKFETYTISAFAPNMPNNTSPNLYIRDASYLTGEETFRFTVSRDNFNNNDKFYRIYNVKSSADWFNVIQRKIHIRNNQPAYIYATIADSILNQPSLYNAKIFASRADKTKMPEFESMATIIVPYEFTSSNNYSLFFENEKVMPGMHKRYFLKIPAGTSNLNISVTSDRKQFTDIRFYLHDVDGRNKLFGRLKANSDEGRSVKHFQDLTPGVYEFVVLGQFTSTKESTFSLEFEVDGINILGHSISDNQINVINYFSKTKQYEFAGKILGYQVNHQIKLNGQTTYEMKFSLKDGEEKKTFDLSLSKEDFNKVTDFALMIYDENGKARETGGFSYKDESISIKKSDKPGTEHYSLVMVPAFTNGPTDMEINIIEKVFLEKTNEINVKLNDRNDGYLYPFVENTLSCEFEFPKIELTKDQKFFGEIIFKSGSNDEIEFTKFLKINN